MVSLADTNIQFETLLRDAGYEVRPNRLDTTQHEGRIAENEYFAVAYQPFETWTDLNSAVEPAELELAARMQHGTSKIWDAYLLLGCLAQLTDRLQYDQLVRIQYNTKRMRKLVMPGLGDELTALNDLIRPFVSLRHVNISAQSRDPLLSISRRLVERGHDQNELDRLMASFRSGKSLDNA
jgi:hypothetical protein